MSRDLFGLIGLIGLFLLEGCGSPAPAKAITPDVDRGSSSCSDGWVCMSWLECGDGVHCPKGKCCEILGVGNDAGLTSGTRRVVGEPQSK